MINNKKLYGFSGSEENMVQKLAQQETSKFNPCLIWCLIHSLLRLKSQVFLDIPLKK